MFMFTFMVKKNKYVHFKKITAALTTLLLLQSCQGMQTPAPSSASNDLRSGLMALDTGNTSTAEQDFLQGLQADPTNSEIRLNLASLYASEAGIKLQDWLDPLINAANDLGNQLGSIDNQTQAISAAVGLTSSTTNSSSSSSSNSSNPVGQYAISGITDALKIDIILGYFWSIPALTSTQQAQFSKAIATLRGASTNPAARSIDIRNYLTVLAVVQLIPQFKILLTDPGSNTVDLSLKQFCLNSPSQIDAALLEIQLSLEYLVEGLTPSASDPTSTMTSARNTAYTLMLGVLNQSYWTQLNSIFSDSGTLRPDLNILLKQFCPNS
jgi:hypothetical protein